MEKLKKKRVKESYNLFGNFFYSILDFFLSIFLDFFILILTVVALLFLIGYQSQKSYPMHSLMFVEDGKLYYPYFKGYINIVEVEVKESYSNYIKFKKDEERINVHNSYITITKRTDEDGCKKIKMDYYCPLKEENIKDYSLKPDHKIKLKYNTLYIIDFLKNFKSKDSLSQAYFIIYHNAIDMNKNQEVNVEKLQAGDNILYFPIISKHEKGDKIYEINEVKYDYRVNLKDAIEDDYIDAKKGLKKFDGKYFDIDFVQISYVFKLIIEDGVEVILFLTFFLWYFLTIKRIMKNLNAFSVIKWIYVVFYFCIISIIVEMLFKEVILFF